MTEADYLNWVVANTPTRWWHDSADSSELAVGLERGASGVTTNPVLTATALTGSGDPWATEVKEVLAEDHSAEEKAEGLMGVAVRSAARTLLPVYEDTHGADGYVCAQVNPARAADRDAMLAMTRRFHAWAPNIAVKLPATAAGLDVLEDAVAEGITITATVSFTVPQVLAIGERHQRGVRRATQKGIEPGRCYAVIMIGRLDDYLRDVVLDSRADVSENDIQSAGLAVTKRAYALSRQRGYEATLIIAALRGTYHMTGLVGAELIMSIHPKYQTVLLQPGVPRQEHVADEVPQKSIDRLATLPEFVRAYEPDGMRPEDFITFGPTQKTLSQFHAAGWKCLEDFTPTRSG